jgi:hypothetical protein
LASDPALDQRYRGCALRASIPMWKSRIADGASPMPESPRFVRRQLVESNRANINPRPFEFRCLQIEIYARHFDNRQIQIGSLIARPRPAFA